MKDRADHLRELELSEKATADDIRQAYRDLARVWHPDRFASDPRMQAKASDKLRRVIEAYEFLQAHPNRGEPAPRPTGRKDGGRRQRRAADRARSRRDEVRQALTTLEERARLLDEKVKEVNRRGVTSWEHRAWLALACGMGIPIVVFFVAIDPVMALAGPLFVVFVASCVSVLGLAGYRNMRLFEQTEEEIDALRQADLVCGACGRRFVGSVLPSRAEEALGRVGWARANLKCPRCRRALI
jgi:hypothetical protein